MGAGRKGSPSSCSPLNCFSSLFLCFTHSANICDSSQAAALVLHWALGPALTETAMAPDLGPMSQGRPLDTSALQEVLSTVREGRHQPLLPALALTAVFGDGPLTGYSP